MQRLYKVKFPLITLTERYYLITRTLGMGIIILKSEKQSRRKVNWDGETGRLSNQRPNLRRR